MRHGIYLARMRQDGVPDPGSSRNSDASVTWCIGNCDSRCRPSIRRSVGSTDSLDLSMRSPYPLCNIYAFHRSKPRHKNGGQALSGFNSLNLSPRSLYHLFEIFAHFVGARFIVPSLYYLFFKSIPLDLNINCLMMPLIKLTHNSQRITHNYFINYEPGTSNIELLTFNSSVLVLSI
jgi:hypothetical protein